MVPLLRTPKAKLLRLLRAWVGELVAAVKKGHIVLLAIYKITAKLNLLMVAEPFAGGGPSTSRMNELEQHSVNTVWECYNFVYNMSLLEACGGIQQ